MIRVERGHDAALIVFVVDDEGAAIDADALPTVTFTEWDGTVIATAVESSRLAEGEYRAVMPAVDRLTLIDVVWVIAVDGLARPQTEQVEIVAGFYFDIATLRAKPGMESTDRYPFAELVNAREWAQDLVERECATSFLERFHIDRVTVATCSRIGVEFPWLRSLVSADVDGVAVDGTPQIGGRTISGDWPAGLATIAYTSAFETEVPRDLHDALVTAARYHLMATIGASGIPDRTRSQSNADGTIVLSVAGEKAPTGLPEVDVVISGYARRSRYPMMA
mgnify:CR=1 FL=1